MRSPTAVFPPTDAGSPTWMSLPVTSGDVAVTTLGRSTRWTARAEETDYAYERSRE
jgi:hypothetical protein